MENTCRVLYSASAITEDDCNCACPVDLIPAAAQPAPRPGAALRPAPGLRRFALDSGWSAVYDPARAQVTALNAAALALLDSVSDPRPPAALDSTASVDLYRRGLLVDGAERPPRPAPPVVLAAWLHLTGACNLRCQYCYVDHAGAAMPVETALASVDSLFAIARARAYRAVKIKYAGGEPALAFAVLQAAHQRAARLAAESGLALDSVMLSNGTLLDDAMLVFLRENGVRLMISIDGLGAVHDRQRPSAGGAGLFGRVARAIERAAAAGVPPHLSITVTARNAGRLAEVVDFALARGLRFTLNFYRAPGMAQGDPLAPAPDALVAGVRAAFRAAEARPGQASLLACLDLANLSVAHESACGAGQNYLVVLPDGRFSYCQMQAGEAAAPGADGAAAQFAAVNRLAAARMGAGLPAECAACDYRLACAGGCAMFSNGGQRARSPYCAVYQTLFPDLIRLEARRLIAQDGRAR